MNATEPRSRRITLVVTLILLAGILVVGLVAVFTRATTKGTIAVTGIATVTGVPDTASFQIGVITTASSAKAALAANNVHVRSLEASLFAHGVTRRELQTSGLDIYANTNPAGVVTGFSVNDTLSVTITGLSNLGTVLDAGANAAGNGVTLSGITFSLSKDSGLLARARVAALRNAKLEASQIASAAGTSVGRVLKIVDQENESSNVVVPFAPTFAASKASVPVQAGSLQVSDTIAVTYALSR